MSKQHIHSLYILPFIAMVNLTISYGQSQHQHLRKGDGFYNEQQFDRAEEEYRRALEKDPSLKSKYNLGNTLYNQKRYEEAIQKFKDASIIGTDEKSLADTWYNLGNSRLSAGEYVESIEAYKKALEYSPDDMDAIKNLYIARTMKQQQEQQEQQQQQNQEKEEGERQEEQSGQESEPEDQNDDQNEAGDDTQDLEEGSEKKPMEEKTNLSREDAERLLRVVENEEKKVQERMRKGQGTKPKSKKDW